MGKEFKPKRVYVIAEMACSHEGNIELGQKIIDGAGLADADAIQFQIWKVKDLLVPAHPDYGLLKRIELSHDKWSALYEYVKNRYPTMDVIACVADNDSIDFAESIGVDAYKLHSADLSNPDLIKYAAQTGKRIDLSIGASTLDEIQHAIEWILAGSDASAQNIWLMYGYQSFPTPTNQIHLDYMKTLKNLFQLPVGYQDHTDAERPDAFWLPAAAVGMDIDILEKHITHDRSVKGIDHQAALNPDEFAQFTGMVREIEAAKGNPCPRSFSSDELAYRKYSKKSLVAVKPLSPGDTIDKTALKAMRSFETGLPPDQIHKLIGRAVKNNIDACQIVLEKDLI